MNVILIGIFEMTLTEKMMEIGARRSVLYLMQDNMGTFQSLYHTRHLNIDAVVVAVGSNRDLVEY